MTTGIVYSDIYLEHKIGQHVESHERLITIMDFLKENGVLDDPNFKLIEPRKATLDQIKYVHEESLIKEVKEVIEKPPIEFDKEVKKADEGISIFLSYTTKDTESFKIKEIAINLSRFPEIEDVFYWEEDMKDNIILYMESTLKRCDVLLLFCSPNALQSAAVEDEWMASLSLKKPIIPVFFNNI